MHVAQVYDAVAEDGQPYLSADLPRLVDPELRSRAIGYLATAPQARSGRRTDGTWVWPESLADQVRARGAGPARELLEHMSARNFQLPVGLPSDVLDAAGRATAVPHRPSDRPRATYLAGNRKGTGSTSHVIRRTHDVHGATVEECFGRNGWDDTEPIRSGAGTPVEFEEVSERRASALIDELSARWHDHLVSRGLESALVGTGPRIARVFDGESPSGSPWFSPNRLRIVERERRERMASYLEGGRLVMRATGRAVDPLTPDKGRVVPLNYRTDGVWVWQEALAYYLRGHGVAPELALLCHIEERGIRLPDSVPDEVVGQAVAVAKRPTPPGIKTEPMTYYAAYHRGRLRLLARAPRGDVLRGESFCSDLRWRRSNELWRESRRGEANLVEIGEEEAVQIVDDHWARGAAD
jgi:hypothetical protein